MRGLLGTIGSMSDLITKLLPILHVADPDAERRFYNKLGLRTTYEGPERQLAVQDRVVEAVQFQPDGDRWAG